MLRKLAVALIVTLLATAAQAETPAASLKSVAEDAVAQDGVTGIVIGVALKEQAPVIVASGLADVERNAAMTPDTDWKIASIAKTFVAALALSLEGEGRISLDDKLARYLPDIPNADRVTLRQLLDQTAGYNDYITDAFADAAQAHPGKAWTPRELLAYAGPEHLHFTPGSRYDYSNTNYLLARMALDAALGHDCGQEIRTRFLDRLGLRHTWLAAAEKIPAGALAHGYSDISGEGKKEDVTGEAWELGGADGAMVSNAGDLIAWFRALFGGKLLPQKQFAEMMTFVMPPEEEGGPGSGYGLGIERSQVAGVTLYGHTGSAPGYNSTLLYDPATRTTIVIALNEDPEDEALLDILAERVVQALESTGAVHFTHANAGAQPPAKE